MAKMQWVTIHVNDMKKSLDFYSKVMKFEKAREFQTPEGMELTFFHAGDVQVELIFEPNKTDNTYGNGISMGFDVESLDEWITHLKQFNIIIKPEDIIAPPGIRFFMIKDPNGVNIQIKEDTNITH